MTSLNNQWQELRRQRQQDLAERKQQVRKTLTQFEQERQAMASQLRDDLNLFQRELQQGTQAFLTNATQERQAQAEQLAALLQSFVQALQMETQGMLKATHQQRLKDELRLALELAAFIEDLRRNVRAYMSELELIRKDRAQQLQTMLQEDRNRRSAEMDAMFQELTTFRTELRQYCDDLRAKVWGAEGILKPDAAKSQSNPAPQMDSKPFEPVVAQPIIPVHPELVPAAITSLEPVGV